MNQKYLVLRDNITNSLEVDT